MTQELQSPQPMANDMITLQIPRPAFEVVKEQIAALLELMEQASGAAPAMAAPDQAEGGMNPEDVAAMQQELESARG